MKKLISITWIIIGLVAQAYLAEAQVLPVGSRIATYQKPGFESFRVPAGVSVITIEAWGGGGGGSYYLGGQGGGYIYAKIPVTPNEVLQIRIGEKGTGGGTQGGDGENTTIVVPLGTNAFTLIGYGGYGGGKSTDQNPGYGYTFNSSGNVPFDNLAYRGQQGKNGGTNSILSLSPVDAQSFYRIDKAGKGGDAGNADKTGGEGGSSQTLMKHFTFGYGPAEITSISTAVPGSAPGGGGGGTPGLIISGVGHQNGADGAAGLMTITF